MYVGNFTHWHSGSVTHVIWRCKFNLDLPLDHLLYIRHTTRTTPAHAARSSDASGNAGTRLSLWTDAHQDRSRRETGSHPRHETADGWRSFSTGAAKGKLHGTDYASVHLGDYRIFRLYNNEGKTNILRYFPLHSIVSKYFPFFADRLQKGASGAGPGVCEPDGKQCPAEEGCRGTGDAGKDQEARKWIQFETR